MKLLGGYHFHDFKCPYCDSGLVIDDTYDDMSELVGCEEKLPCPSCNKVIEVKADITFEVSKEEI